MVVDDRINARIGVGQAVEENTGGDVETTGLRHVIEERHQ